MCVYKIFRKIYILIIVILLTGCASTVSGTRWYCGTMEFSFGDGNWTMFDVSSFTGEKGSYKEKDNYLLLTATQKYVNNNDGTNTWVSIDPCEYTVTFVGDKLFLDKGTDDLTLEFVRR